MSFVHLRASRAGRACPRATIVAFHPFREAA